MLASSYPWQHWDGCMCDRCTGTYRQHNPQLPNILSCGCKGCQTRYTAEQESRRKDAIAQTLGHERAVNLSMASINICEREGCGALVKGNALGGLTLVMVPDLHSGMGNGSQPIRMELCPACVEDVYNVVKFAPVGPRERTYGKPFNPQDREEADLLDQVDDEGLAAELLTRLIRSKAGQRMLRATKSDDILDGDVTE